MCFSIERNFVNHLREAGAEVSWHDPLVSTWLGENSRSVNGDYDLAVVLVAHSTLNMRDWNGGSIFTVNFNPKFPDWQPLLGVPLKK